MTGDAEQQLRGYVEYLRDIGIYDLYRRGEPVAAAAELAGVDAAALVDGARFAEAKAASPAVEQVDTGVAGATRGQGNQRAEVGTDKLVGFNALVSLPEVRVPKEARAEALKQIQQDLGDCTRCPLAYAGRHTIVFGDGSPTAEVMFVGEGPGADEDATGVPFVGKAGQLLNNMIGAMGLKREEVYIANVVKCRPPGNRVPEPVEANTCSQFLLRQMDVLQPKVVVALGATAAMYLLGVKQSLSTLRGRWHEVRGSKLVVTYHPAFLLRDPRQKAEAWKDLQMVMAEMGLKPQKRSEG